MRYDADVSEANFYHFVQLLKLHVYNLIWGIHLININQFFSFMNLSQYFYLLFHKIMFVPN